MRVKLQFVPVFLLLLIASLSAAAQSDHQKFDAGAIEREIRAFYDGYAEDLRARRGSAVADRYDRQGAYFLGNGEKRFEPYDKIVEIYGKWRGPKSFAWKDLSIEVLSHDAAAVVVMATGGSALRTNRKSSRRRRQNQPQLLPSELLTAVEFRQTSPITAWPRRGHDIAPFAKAVLIPAQD
jgi:hypothetical protein